MFDFGDVQTSCRISKMLPNAYLVYYLLAKIGFDTAENEPARKITKFAKCCQ